MKQLYIQQQNTRRLHLFFAGWGMDETPFLSYHPQESDFMICYDYRTLRFDEELLARYHEIHLTAWSMGVWAASQVMQGLSLPIVHSTAFNGTLYPVDEKRGIPPTIFEGTLNGLNETTLRKFQRRMCGTASAYNAFMEVSPKRSIVDLKEELSTIGEQYHCLPPSSYHWDKAIIGHADRIFLPENQLNAWTGKTTIKHIEVSHYEPKVFNQLFIEQFYE